MKSSMEVSLYPLGTSDLGPSISRFISILEEHGCQVETGPMSTLVTADSAVLFEAMKRAYELVASEGGVVVVMKISNACPMKILESPLSPGKKPLRTGAAYNVSRRFLFLQPCTHQIQADTTAYRQKRLAFFTAGSIMHTN